MERIIIAGGSGLIGRALAIELAQAGYPVVVLSRNPAKVARLGHGITVEAWDGQTAAGWGALADGAQAIVNLAGENIGIPPFPWTAERKRRLASSRMNAARAVVQAVAAATIKPRVVIQSSAIGYYGLHGDELLNEAEAPGSDFLSRLACEWESSTLPVEEMGVRRVIIRTGVVLSQHGGALAFLALPFRMFVGGPLGSGKQWVSWIHLSDEVGAIRHLIETESARGPYDLTAPESLTNADLGRTLARVLKRPYGIPVPAPLMKLALGEMAELMLLGGQRVGPQRLQEAGFHFRFPTAEGALRNLLLGAGEDAGRKDSLSHEPA